MATMSDISIDRLDGARLAACTAIRSVECYESIGSTQDRAHQVAQFVERSRLPLLIAAEEQTAGRGRGSNTWWTARGSLAFSLLFDPADWELTRRAMPERSLAVGVAIVDTVAPLLAGQRVGLHWPNDVYVGTRKLAGILIDVRSDGLHVVGVGLNVNNSFEGAPQDVRKRATSLFELTDRTFDRTDLLESLLRNLRATCRVRGGGDRVWPAIWRTVPASWPGVDD